MGASYGRRSEPWGRRMGPLKACIPCQCAWRTQVVAIAGNAARQGMRWKSRLAAPRRCLRARGPARGEQAGTYAQCGRVEWRRGRVVVVGFFLVGKRVVATSADFGASGGLATSRDLVQWRKLRRRNTGKGPVLLTLKITFRAPIHPENDVLPYSLGPALACGPRGGLAISSTTLFCKQETYIEALHIHSREVDHVGVRTYDLLLLACERTRHRPRGRKMIGKSSHSALPRNLGARST